jgi:hypothetical protein
MINLIDVEEVLKDAGYRCRVASFNPELLLFEDDSILGFVNLFETVKDLLDQWRDKQRLFIQRSSSALRSSTKKSWNCYAIFLCASPANIEQRQGLNDIEEDLSLIRKLVSDGVSTRRDIQRALLPILPIQNRTTSADIASPSLGERLENWPRSAILVLEGDGTPVDLIELLLEATE